MVGSAGGGVTSAGSLRELVERLRAQPRFALPTGNGGGSVGSGGGSDAAMASLTAHAAAAAAVAAAAAAASSRVVQGIVEVEAVA